MFAFDGKPLPSAVHSSASKAKLQRLAHASPVNPLWFRPDGPTNAGAAVSLAMTEERRRYFEPRVPRSHAPWLRAGHAIAEADIDVDAPPPIAPATQFNLVRIPATPLVLQRKPAINPQSGLLEHASTSSANAKEVLDAEAAARVAQGGGEPLSSAERFFFEPRFGRDLSQVRVHADGEAASAAQAVRARAYTMGRHIVFGSGQYQPATSEGRLLLAHELTHVVQQIGSSADIVHRKPAESYTSPSIAAQGEPSATERLRAIVADIEQVLANSRRRLVDTATGAKGTPENQAHAEKIENFLERLRAVANDSDEDLKLSVLAGFSSSGVRRAEAQVPEVEAVEQRQGSENLAAKSIEVSHPLDAQEIEADRVAEAVVHGAHATVTRTTSEGLVNRQADQLAAAGAFILAAEAESLPATSWNPPGWVVLGVATVVAAALIGTAVYMASKINGDKIRGNTERLAEHLARILALIAVGGVPSGEPPKNNNDNDPHWWKEIKAFLKNIRDGIGDASRKQAMRELQKKFTEEQILEIERRLAEAARKMGESPPPFLPPP